MVTTEAPRHAKFGTLVPMDVRKHFTLSMIVKSISNHGSEDSVVSIFAGADSTSLLVLNESLPNA